MNLIKQPNRWSCGLASLAMLFDSSVEEIVNLLGHDGSEIKWADYKEPFCRRAFHTQEFQDISNHFGFILSEIVGVPMLCAMNPEDAIPMWELEHCERRLMDYMNGNQGLIIGQYSLDKFHMCAWDGYEVLDPMEPRRYSLDSRDQQVITIGSFWLKSKIAS